MAKKASSGTANATPPQLLQLYDKLEAAEVYARWNLHEYELALEMDAILKKIHRRYIATRKY